MSCTPQWSLRGNQHVYINNSQEAITEATKENLIWKTFTTYSILVLQTPFKFQTNMKFFEDFVCVLQMTFLTKIKKILMSVLGLNSKDRKSTRDKANISNPKVNRGCAPLTSNRISAECVQISLAPSIPYIPLGSTILGDSTLWSTYLLIWSLNTLRTLYTGILKAELYF